MSILIKDVLLNNEKKDILIEGNRISKIDDKIYTKTEYEIDGKDKAAIPGFFNAHTHAAMTLMRGYSDDLIVMEWLRKKIWPLEEKLTEEDVYWGAKLACLEMIKSGTTFFNDMYWYYHGTAKAVEEMGIRAAISAVFIDFSDKGKAKEQQNLNSRLFKETKKYSDRVQFALGPHAIYSVSTESLLWAKEFADRNNCLIHIHLSESKHEVDDCKKNHRKTPIEYLNDIRFLGPNIIAAHNIWVNEKEIRILKENDVKIVHTPSSNMKLSSGVFPYKKIKKSGLTVSLGTDGCASNNNLDMLEEMKIASILQKISSTDPTLQPAHETFELATINGAITFGINAGVIEERKLADLLLIDLKKPFMVPQHNLLSNLVFSANGSCVDTTICDGKILMQNGKVEGEEEIIEKSAEVARSLVSRV